MSYYSFILSFGKTFSYVTIFSRHSIISEPNAPVFEPSQSRSLSELELFRQKCNLPEDGEFYTAIGPDGKPRALISKKHLQKHLPMRQ